MITKIKKRDGREAPFNIEKIANAIFKAANEIGGQNYQTAMDLAERVTIYIEQEMKTNAPTVEEIQDAVEKILIETGHAKTAKEYILYRAERTRIREMDTRLMKIYEDLPLKKPKTTTSSGKMPILTATPPWVQCSSMDQRGPSNSMKCLSSIPTIQRPIKRARSIFMIWTF